ncbi:MAG: hypothetical protein JSV16_13325 [Candidatus Hydrogenedentota bacterium]|nr:MAG: hypothetical protein JSV16_13325 [Candidatus Hydrogenedentota bacterium]
MARAILDGARFASNDQAMAYARERVIDAFAAHGEICRITHIADGTHSDGSSHYRNCADDYGFVDVPETKRLAILRDAREALNAGALVCGKFEGESYSDFLLIYGDENHEQHMHLQYKPMRAMNR